MLVGGGRWSRGCECLFLMCCRFPFFFFNDTATTEIYTLSLHDALPISNSDRRPLLEAPERDRRARRTARQDVRRRSEEHTSELQSLAYLVCRLLLEKKKEATVSKIGVEQLFYLLSLGMSDKEANPMILS